MKKIVLSTCFFLLLTSFMWGITLSTKDTGDMEFSLSGTLWFRYSVGYIGTNMSSNIFTINRNYITSKLATNNYESVVTLDIVNSKEAQKAGDFQVWLKFGYIDFTKIPLLSDFGIKLRAGIQPNNFGTNTTWTYNLYPAPVESETGLSSADIGVSILGKIPEGFGSYEISLFSGEGYTKMDTDYHKAICATTTIIPIKGMGLKLSYYKKHGLATIDNATDIKIGSIMASFAFDPIVDSYIAYILSDGLYPDGFTGTKLILAAYCGMKILDWLSVHFRCEFINPDTDKTGDEPPISCYYTGVNIQMSEKLTLMLNYSLKHKNYNPGSNNDNLIVSQIKWAW